MPKPTTRNAIYDFLLENPLATSAEVARKFRLSGATVRHHLLLLAEEGRITVLENARDGQRGRPHQRYSVVRRGEADLISSLLEALLGIFPTQTEEATSGAEGIKGVLVAAIQNQLSYQPGQSVSMTPRMIHLVEALTRLGYAARWEVRSPNPVVIFQNCPYARVQNRQPVLCQADAAVLSKALGMTAVPTSVFELDEHGRRICRFAIT